MDELHIGDERTTLGGATLAVGAASLAVRDLERAIDTVEDEIMRVAPSLRLGDTVETGDERIRDLARACAASDNLSVEAIEQAFNQLATRGLPSNREAAATLVILRELMHHLGIRTIRLRQ